MMQLDSFTNGVLLAIFIGGVFAIICMNSEGILHSTGRRIRSAQPSGWTLQEFIRLKNKPGSESSFLFSEQSVYSMGHRFNGRFDNAILHWEDAPVLDAIIERKFPTRYFPDRPREEDFFQAELYALALMETGVSCVTTKLVLVYCLQRTARNCIGKNQADCVSCRDGTIHSRRFSQKRVLKALAKLDEVWYQGRKPEASPSARKCRACPYGRNGVCNRSAA
ncbi:MAG: hypothetical protein ACFFER_00270 [Candidatus Thorarchaeota archaeon]